MKRQLVVIGGGFAGLTAALTAAEAGAEVTVHEAHGTLGGRARTSPGPYRTNDGPHALYDGGPHWSWLKRRGLLRPLAPIPPAEGLRMRFHTGGTLRRFPPLGLVRLLRHRTAPSEETFLAWASRIVGPETAVAAAHYSAVALFHHDPGGLSAAFVQERFRRSAMMPPEAHYPRGGWGTLIARMADRARERGVVIETGSRIESLAQLRGGPVVVATTLDAARRLLKDPSLTWHSGRTALLDLALERRRDDAFVVADLEGPGWTERFTAQDPTLAPPGQSLIQAQFPIAPDERKSDGLARAERVLDLGFPDWRQRTLHFSDAVANARTGAVDPVGTTWRDRPAIDRGDDVYLAGDQVAAPGVLSEVSFTSAVEATRLALRTADEPAVV